jgi:hypothetical protein
VRAQPLQRGGSKKELNMTSIAAPQS